MGFLFVVKENNEEKKNRSLQSQKPGVFRFKLHVISLLNPKCVFILAERVKGKSVLRNHGKKALFLIWDRGRDDDKEHRRVPCGVPPRGPGAPFRCDDVLGPLRPGEERAHGGGPGPGDVIREGSKDARGDVLKTDVGEPGVLELRAVLFPGDEVLHGHAHPPAHGAERELSKNRGREAHTVTEHNVGGSVRPAPVKELARGVQEAGPRAEVVRAVHRDDGVVGARAREGGRETARARGQLPQRALCGTEDAGPDARHRGHQGSKKQRGTIHG